MSQSENNDQNDESQNYNYQDDNHYTGDNKQNINNNSNNNRLSSPSNNLKLPKRGTNSNNKFIRHTSYSQQKQQNSAQERKYQESTPTLKRKGDSAHLDKQAKKYSFPKNNNFFLYSPDSLLPDLNPFLNQLIEIRIAKEFINKSNFNIIKRNIYGQDCYSSNSDAVCQLIHHGFIRLEDIEHDQYKKYQGVSYLVKVQRSRKAFNSCQKNNLLSRTFRGYQGLALKPESCTWLNQIGKEDELKQAASRMATLHGRKRVKQEKVPNYKALIPIPEVNIVFNMNNDPAYKFSITNICDKSQDIKTWTSYKLKTQVLYLENNFERYEIARIEMLKEGQDEHIKKEEDNIFNWDNYRFSKVINPQSKDNAFMETVTRPLPLEHIQVIYNECDWSQFQWGSDYMKIKDVELQNIKSYKYYLRSY